MIKITPTRSREFDSCGLQYKLKYVDALGPKELEHAPALSFGSSLHACMDELHRPGRRLVQPVAPESTMRRHWQRDGYVDAEQEAQYYDKGVQILGRYMEVMTVPAGRILATEAFFSRVVVVGGHRFELGCKADRIELLPDGRLELLDYKTNADGNVPTVEMLATDVPTYIYFVLGRICYPSHPHVVVSQLNLLTLKKVLVDYTPEQLAANKATLIDSVARIEAGEFEARPNGHCVWCPVRIHCPFGGPEVNLEGVL
jgi:RecB family exonuclease